MASMDEFLRHFDAWDATTTLAMAEMNGMTNDQGCITQSTARRLAAASARLRNDIRANPGVMLAPRDPQPAPVRRHRRIILRTHRTAIPVAAERTT